MKMKKQALLILSLGLLFVGCDKKGESSSVESSSTFDVEAYYKQVFETFDSLGHNYDTTDYFRESYSQAYGYDDPLVTEVTVTDDAIFDWSLATGLARVGTGKDAKYYRYGVDFYEGPNNQTLAEFIPTYKPIQAVENGGRYYYNPTNGQDKVTALYTITNKATYESVVKQGGAKSLREIFEVTEDEYGDPMLTTDNLNFGVRTLTDMSYMNLPGYTSTAVSSINSILVDESNPLKPTYATLTTNIQVMTDPTYGINQLYIAVYSSAFGPSADSVPVLERILTPLKDMDESLLENYDTFVPKDFVTNGPGQEPEEIKTKKQKFVNAVKKLQEKNNFSNDLDLAVSEDQSGNINYETYYTAKVVSRKYVEYDILKDNFAYGYYNVSMNADSVAAATNKDVRGIYAYDTRATGDDKEITMINYQLFKEANEGTYDDTKWIYSYTSSNGQQQQIDVNKWMDDRYESIFYDLNSLTDKVDKQNSDWPLLGSTWTDGLFVSQRTDDILVTDYDLKNALLGTNTVIANMNTHIKARFATYDVSDQGVVDITAQITLFDEENGQIGNYILGRVKFKDLGTTKAHNEIGTYVKKKYGDVFKDLPVLEK